MRLLRFKEKEETVLQQMQGEDVATPSAPIARLQKALERRKRNVQIANATSWATLSAELATLPLVIHTTVVGTEQNSSHALAIWAASFSLLAAVVLVYTWLGKKELERSITNITENMEDSAIGPLLDMVTFYGPYNAFGTMGSDYRSYQAAVNGLTHLLPLLSTEESPSIDTPQLRELPRLLRYASNPLSRRRYNIPFALAILKALEQVGNSSAIPIVERLAKRTPQQDDSSLRAAAEACLIRLRERSQEVELQSSLLRASSSVPTDTLLRAAIETSPTDSTQLLRAGQEERR